MADSNCMCNAAKYKPVQILNQTQDKTFSKFILTFAAVLWIVTIAVAIFSPFTIIRKTGSF